MTEQIDEMPAKDVNDFRYHRLEKDNQYNDLQVRLILIIRISKYI